MRKDVDRYVDNCETCQRTKPRRDKAFGLLSPLPVPSGIWKSMTLDYIRGLPEKEGHNAILVVVDRLSKMAHYIPTTKEVNAQETVRLLLHHVWKYHGTPKEILCDRGPQFDSQVWKQPCKDLRIEQKMSTAYHSQTDGQTERTNQSLEHYLRAYVDYMQDNWLELLPFAEFVYNRTTNESTKKTPFQAIYGQNPDIEIPTTESIDGIPQDMQKIEDHLKSEMARAQDIQWEQANTLRTPAPCYAVGDKAYLPRGKLRTSRPCPKLDQVFLGPFKILQRIGTRAYKLEFPPTMRIHPVFHVSRLKPCLDKPFPQQLRPEESPPEIINGEEEYLVETILNQRKHHGRTQYHVKWTSYDNPTWESEESLQNAKDLVKALLARHTNRSRKTAAPRKR